MRQFARYGYLLVRHSIGHRRFKTSDPVGDVSEDVSCLRNPLVSRCVLRPWEVQDRELARRYQKQFRMFTVAAIMGIICIFKVHKPLS